MIQIDISALGINKGKIRQFNSKGIYTVEDLIKFLPRDYLDFRKNTPIANIRDENGLAVSVIGKVIDTKEGDNYFKAKIIDNSNKRMTITWFNQKYVKNIIEVGKTYNFCGIGVFNKQYFSRQMINPMYFDEDLKKYKRIVPIYSKIQGMSDNYLLRSINTALALVDKSEYLDVEVVDKFSLYKRKDTIKAIHQPDNLDDIKMAKQRILFDDLFYFASKLLLRDSLCSKLSQIKMKKAYTINPFLKTLPFTLTNDQLEVARNIFKDLRDGRKVSALIQGDVGSGKTIVAFILMLIAAENEYQSALMCPTQVLAKQHFSELKEIGEKMEYKVELLTGDTKTRKKKEILKSLKTGEVDMVVGTHAIISKEVEFNNLGLTIIDEEHRFGVIQRELINEKTNEGVHTVTMSATPIPRSLALSIYGDYTQIYNINQMPIGRKPIITKLTNNEEETYLFMKEEIKKGRQCYVVCPLIEESDSEKMKGVLSVDEVYANIKRYYLNDNIKVSMITGNMKQADIETEINKFTKGDIDILISTTIIEVGVNIPNSTVMVIQNAERFGLAQLHQLRGRVGRGNYQSYCILISNFKDSEKLLAMTNTTNGFEIAEADLKLRGAGDFIGTKQSGDNKYVMLMLAYPKLFSDIKKEIKEIFGDKKRYTWYSKYFEEINE